MATKSFSRKLTKLTKRLEDKFENLSESVLSKLSNKSGKFFPYDNHRTNNNYKHSQDTWRKYRKDKSSTTKIGFVFRNDNVKVNLDGSVGNNKPYVKWLKGGKDNNGNRIFKSSQMTANDWDTFVDDVKKEMRNIV